MRRLADCEGKDVPEISTLSLSCADRPGLVARVAGFLAERGGNGHLRHDGGTAASDQAAVQSAAINLDYTRIKAPFGGVVTSRSIDVGNLVTVGTASATPLFTVTDQTKLRIYPANRSDLLVSSLPYDDGCGLRVVLLSAVPVAMYRQQVGAWGVWARREGPRGVAVVGWLCRPAPSDRL